MGRELVLITGATGFIGFRVLVRALEAGYRVRCAVRSSDGIKQILAAPSIKAINPNENRLCWSFVPDSASPGAYDGAVAGTKYIIHCAAPVPRMDEGEENQELSPEQQDQVYVKPAVDTVLGMLQSAAQKSGDTVKRIVLTSSILAIIPYDLGLELAQNDQLREKTKMVFGAESRVVPLPKAPYGAGFAAYSVSKAAALNASEEWVRSQNPRFDIVSVIPAWVWGPHELAKSSAGMMRTSNGVPLALLQGGSNPVPLNGAFISVYDVADAHVLALQPKVAGNKAFVLSIDAHWEDVKAVAKKHFPRAFEQGVFSDKGSQAEMRYPLDAGMTEEHLLGRSFRGFEETVVNTAGAYLELVERSSTTPNANM